MAYLDGLLEANKKEMGEAMKEIGSLGGPGAATPAVAWWLDKEKDLRDERKIMIKERAEVLRLHNMAEEERLRLHNMAEEERLRKESEDHRLHNMAEEQRMKRLADDLQRASLDEGGVLSMSSIACLMYPSNFNIILPTLHPPSSR